MENLHAHHLRQMGLPHHSQFHQAKMDAFSPGLRERMPELTPFVRPSQSQRSQVRQLSCG